MRDVVRSRWVKPSVFAGYLVITSIAMTASAAAHVKWFVNCGVSDNPLPVQAVLTTSFFQFLALFLALFYLACMAEQTVFGAMLLRLLDRCTARFTAARMNWCARRRRSFSPCYGLKAASFSRRSSILAAFLSRQHSCSSRSVCLPGRRSPLRARGSSSFMATVSWTTACSTCWDYPVFLGLGAYFMLSVSQNARILAFRHHLLRWTAAFSLLWPSMEKFVYPSWIAPITVVHPELTLGLPVATVITAARVVEFGLSFALFWTPLIRRLAALALIVLLTGATFDFGKVDGIGHLIFIAILLVILADPEGKPTRCRPAFAPLLSSVALLPTVSLYTGGHALYYESESATTEPDVFGVRVPASANWLLD